MTMTTQALDSACAKITAAGDDALLTIAELCAFWGVSDSHLRAMEGLTVTMLGPGTPRYRWGHVKQAQRARERAA